MLKRGENRRGEMYNISFEVNGFQGLLSHYVVTYIWTTEKLEIWPEKNWFYCSSQTIKDSYMKR